MCLRVCSCGCSEPRLRRLRERKWEVNFVLVLLCVSPYVRHHQDAPCWFQRVSVHLLLFSRARRGVPHAGPGCVSGLRRAQEDVCQSFMWSM